MTLHQVLNMAAALRQTHLNMTLHDVYHMTQNIIFSNDQSDVVFEGIYTARFVPVHSLLQVAPKKHIWRCQVWQLRRPQVLSIDSVLQWSNHLHNDNKWHSSPSFEDAAHYSCMVPAWTRNASGACSICFWSFFQESGQKWHRHSIQITLYREKANQTILMASQSDEGCSRIGGVI
jgi:hypothetical protein